MRPKRREERQQRVASKRSGREERGRREPLERMARLHDPDEQDLGQHDRPQRRRAGK